MAALISRVSAKKLLSMIIAHERESQSEVTLYRSRAAELRQESAQTSWPDVRERLLALAAQYDLLADSLEQRRV
jgi:hypothetical protein